MRRIPVTDPPAVAAPDDPRDLRRRIIDGLPKEPKRRSLRWALRAIIAWPLVVVAFCLIAPQVGFAQTTAAPGITLNLDNQDGGLSTTLQLIAMMTILTLAPSIIILMTSFTRIIIVLGFVRTAMGTQSTPPNQVLTGVALFLTMFVMAPTFTQIKDDALVPLMNKRITEEVALKRAEQPIRNFMFAQMADDSTEIELFMDMSGKPQPETRQDVPTTTLIPAFVLSELKKAFQIGFLIFVPFLIIDIVIASITMSMGMVMLPPVVISLPFKILLFVLVDGWTLVAESVVRGFNV